MILFDKFTENVYNKSLSFFKYYFMNEVGIEITESMERVYQRPSRLFSDWMVKDDHKLPTGDIRVLAPKGKNVLGLEAKIIRTPEAREISVLYDYRNNSPAEFLARQKEVAEKTLHVHQATYFTDLTKIHPADTFGHMLQAVYAFDGSLQELKLAEFSPDIRKFPNVRFGEISSISLPFQKSDGSKLKDFYAEIDKNDEVNHHDGTIVHQIADESGDHAMKVAVATRSFPEEGQDPVLYQVAEYLPVPLVMTPEKLMKMFRKRIADAARYSSFR